MFLCIPVIRPLYVYTYNCVAYYKKYILKNTLNAKFLSTIIVIFIVSCRISNILILIFSWVCNPCPITNLVNYISLWLLHKKASYLCMYV